MKLIYKLPLKCKDCRHYRVIDEDITLCDLYKGVPIPCIHFQPYEHTTIYVSATITVSFYPNSEILFSFRDYDRKLHKLTSEWYLCMILLINSMSDKLLEELFNLLRTM